ncbi:putative transcription factor bZIP family [Dioscorea sansibarensis]
MESLVRRRPPPPPPTPPPSLPLLRHRAKKLRRRHFIQIGGPPSRRFYGPGAGPPPPFFPASVAGSPPPHPYVWGGQHLIPAYGTPIPFPAMYPHGGMYVHPAGAVYPPGEVEGRPPDSKDQGSVKKKARVGSAAESGQGKSGDGGRATSGSADDDATQSEYEGSSDGKDESSEPQDFAARKNSEAPQHTTAESSYSGKGHPASKLPVLAPGRAVLPCPTTNLSIGMDMWNSTHAEAALIKSRPGMASSPMVGRKTVVPEQQWMQDERELKRQKRKQSNRESARRSRQRKQKILEECEDLARRVDQLNNENNALRSEIEQLNKDSKELELENASIMEELKRLYGPNVLSEFESGNGDRSSTIPADGESNGHMHR